MSSIKVTVTYNTLITKIKQHLAVIGKRAKATDGNSMFSDLTTSTAEDTVLWKDLCNGGAETVIASVAELSGGYKTSDTTITFHVASSRWEDYDGDRLTDLREALSEAMTTFIWNYAVCQYLSIIHPSTGAKYPPIWASPYESRMQFQLKTIRDIAFLKRDPLESDVNYNAITGEVVTDDDSETEETINAIDYENPFDFIQKHHHRGRKGRNIPERYGRKGKRR